MLLVGSEAFTNLSVTRYNQLAYQHKKSKEAQPGSNILYASSEKDDAVDTEEQTGVPCLPPIGESSFNGKTSKDSETIRLDGTSHDVNHVGSEKFELQYTCKVCETRNIHSVSRMGEYNTTHTLQFIFFDLVPFYVITHIFGCHFYYQHTATVLLSLTAKSVRANI